MVITTKSSTTIKKKKVAWFNKGHLKVEQGALLNKRYKILKQKGKGAFSKVLECYDTKSIKFPFVAIKILRKDQNIYAREEIEILRDVRLKQATGEDAKCIRLLRHFKYKQHYCMVFPVYPYCLKTFIDWHEEQGIRMLCIKKITHDLLKSIAFLHENKIVHTDIKLENILLTTYTSADIRLIDFGSATYEEDEHEDIITTSHYRAPEVILGVGWSFPVDIWAIGCVMFELLCGDLMFNPTNNAEHLATIEHYLGVIPRHMAVRSKYSSHSMNVKRRYFSKEGQLRWPKIATKKSHVEYVRDLDSIREEIALAHRYNGSTSEQNQEFYDLLLRLLEIDPEKRITAKEALQHPFIINDRTGEEDYEYSVPDAVKQKLYEYSVKNRYDVSLYRDDTAAIPSEEKSPKKAASTKKPITTAYRRSTTAGLVSTKTSKTGATNTTKKISTKPPLKKTTIKKKPSPITPKTKQSTPTIKSSSKATKTGKPSPNAPTHRTPVTPSKPTSYRASPALTNGRATPHTPALDNSDRDIELNWDDDSVSVSSNDSASRLSELNDGYDSADETYDKNLEKHHKIITTKKKKKQHIKTTKATNSKTTRPPPSPALSTTSSVVTVQSKISSGTKKKRYRKPNHRTPALTNRKFLFKRKNKAAKKHIDRQRLAAEKKVVKKKVFKSSTRYANAVSKVNSHNYRRASTTALDSNTFRSSNFGSTLNSKPNRTPRSNVATTKKATKKVSRVKPVNSSSGIVRKPKTSIGTRKSLGTARPRSSLSKHALPSSSSGRSSPISRKTKGSTSTTTGSRLAKKTKKRKSVI